MSEHTKEPWLPHAIPVYDDGVEYEDRWTRLTVRDYERARACVNAMASRCPDKLPELEAAIVIAIATLEGVAAVHSCERLSAALAAFRGEQT